MQNKCIYCGLSGDLSKSDIIPDALTNAKIINPNVCRIEHNNKFSDLFEDEVIGKLALITNELDIKSSKSKKYAPYLTQINVAGTEYTTKISSDTELFRDKKMRSSDGTVLIGPIEEIQKIKGANNKNISQIDVNELEIEKKVNIDLSVYFSQSMYRMIAKIAYEWYCLHNDINDKFQAFESIIQFITNGNGDNIVTIVGNEELYNIIKVNVNFGSHTLISYVGHDSSVNILVSLFGIAIYNVKVCKNLIDECRNNVIFQELTLDAKRVQFKFDTFENCIDNFYNKFTEVELENGIKAMIPKDMTDLSLQYQLMYVTNYPLFQYNLQCTNKPDEKIIKLIIKYMEETLQASAITLRGLKRFVREHFRSFDEEIKLNPKGTNKKAMFMFYLLLVLGESNGVIKSIGDLNKELKKKFGETININNEFSCKLNEEIFSMQNYAEIILKGAKTIDSWEY